jgi:hypothetical protein
MKKQGVWPGPALGEMHLAEGRVDIPAPQAQALIAAHGSRSFAIGPANHDVLVSLGETPASDFLPESATIAA